MYEALLFNRPTSRYPLSTKLVLTSTLSRRWRPI